MSMRTSVWWHQPPSVSVQHATGPGVWVEVAGADQDDMVVMYLPDLPALRKLASRLCQAVGRAEAERPAGGPETAQDAAKGEGAATES